MEWKINSVHELSRCSFCSAPATKIFRAGFLKRFLTCEKCGIKKMKEITKQIRLV